MYWSIRRICGVFQGFGQVSIEPLPTTRTTFNPTLTPSSPITTYSFGILLPHNTWSAHFRRVVKANIDKLDRLQTRIIRCIEYCLDVDKRRDLPDLYHKYNLEPLDIKGKRNLVKLMYSESKNGPEKRKISKNAA